MLAHPNETYPTAKEIMAKPVKFKSSTIDILKVWKQGHYVDRWGTIMNTTRARSLTILANHLLESYGITGISINYGDRPYGYDPYMKTLMISSLRPSIISTLHEVKHVIDGPSELLACRWSIWLFKEVFPKEFDKLEFRDGGHLLVRKSK